MILLKNIAYYLPVIGAIRLGGSVKTGDVTTPYQNDYFSITEIFKTNGDWVKHPIEKTLTDQLPESVKGRLSEIPVKLMFTDPDLNMSERYEAYDPNTKRRVCAGTGAKCQRTDDKGGLQTLDCVGPASCEFAKTVPCNLMVRALFKIEGQQDELAAFMLRSNSFNAMTTLRTRIELLSAKFGKALRHISLKLVLRAKTSPLSDDRLFYYPDLIVNGDEWLQAEIAQIHLKREAHAEINMDKVEETMALLKNNGTFDVFDEDCFEEEPRQTASKEMTTTENAKRVSASEFTLTLSNPMCIEEHHRVGHHSDNAMEVSQPIEAPQFMESSQPIKDPQSVEDVVDQAKKSEPLRLVHIDKAQKRVPAHKGKTNSRKPIDIL